MLGLTIKFTHPWLLLLLIPAAVFTVLPYFMLSKRYRRTRNRIVSMALHGVIMLLAILVLAGMTITTLVKNDKNEIILLVDVSETEDVASDRRDMFVEEVVEESAFDGYRVGIVTFGFDQRYAVHLTDDIDSVMSAYYSAESPDKTATDIAAALRYTSTLFEYPETAKIVLVTDGKQTDENALSVVRSISAQGIKVDTVNISEDFVSDGVRVTDVIFPDYHVGLNDECNIDVIVSSTVSDRTATFELYDNGVKDPDVKTVNLMAGTQKVTFTKSFDKQGAHEIVVKADLDSDAVVQNNEYCSYYNIEVFTRVLILEQASGQSENLVSILGGGEVPYEVEVVNLKHDADKIPDSVNDLRKYDQVILNNIANSDLKGNLPESLYNYVYSYGGGVFTVGGSDDEGGAHAYNRKDLANSLYQQMLPVQAIDYTPPVGVELVIDVSGSMDGEKLEAAKQGAIQCLDVLSDRDYVGVMTLSTNYNAVLMPTPRTQDVVIKEAILKLESEGSTVFSNAIERACQALKALKKVDKRHIIIVTDGEPTEPESTYLPIAEKYYKESEITISVVGIEMQTATKMQKLVETTGSADRLYQVSDLDSLGTVMQNDLSAPEIKESENVTFHPIIANAMSNLVRGLEHEDFEEEGEEGGGLVTRWMLKTTLDGFYGVRARASADTVITGEYDVPIYSQWKFGNGMVGSFMCDLYGQWSGEFVNDSNGQKFIRNVIGNLMPTENIRTQDIVLNLRSENYINQLGISTTLDDGESLAGEIYLVDEGGETLLASLTEPAETPLDDVYVTNYMNSSYSAMRSTFVIKTSGLYRIEVRKVDSSGNVLSMSQIYKAFAYSKEFAEWENTDGASDNALVVEQIAERGGGTVLDEEEPWGVFTGFITQFERTFDPRFAFIITAIILFLLDIAVRKFKFKWPHEIIRDYKNRKAGRQ